METVHLIENVLTHDKRKKLLRDALPLLMVRGPNFPGKQTHSRIHMLSFFRSTLNDIVGIVQEKTGLDLVIGDSWINWTNGKKKDFSWHDHTKPIGCDYALVYYLKTFPFFSNGTVFRGGFVKAPQNSLILFPSHLEHSAPTSPLRFDRYTLAMDLNIRT